MTTYTFSNIDLTAPVVKPDGTFTQQYHEFFRSLKGGLDKNFNVHGLHIPDINSGDLSPESKTDNGATYYSNDDGQPETIVNQEVHVISTTLKSNPAFRFPVVAAVNDVTGPELGWVVFDEALDKLQAYTSLGWMNL